ncbi:MOSC domain-containing protein [Flammeovirga sp. EKP202]|uniref:MOSC domain-containing protein n=1 Tax=Flammeovirga sp. EKP202 TaxID=2770592 RepID=UPI00165F2729|nr:MOSC N-terminal beta barrel domain-containing protein [Flammeovirga sp. EKP202]MBD0402084.1 MOSC N-terminal beta barrel domain-containing protein [Flammeovirga sp. EKP202]
MELKKINVFPIKSLDSIVLDEVEISEGATLKWDRRWGIHRKSDGRTVNGKKYPTIHKLRTKYDLEDLRVEISSSKVGIGSFVLEGDYTQMNQYLSDYFEEEVYVLENAKTGFPDHSGGNVGASLVSIQTLEKVGEWFDLSVDEVERRMRMNFIIDNESAFGEDNLMGPSKSEPRSFFINDTELRGYKPCERCPVPTRDSITGEAMKGFQKAFLNKRKELQPSILDNELYAHAYMCGIVLNIPEQSVGKLVKSGMSITF